MRRRGIGEADGGGKKKKKKEIVLVRRQTVDAFWSEKEWKAQGESEPKYE